jgi:hypothetical protein
MLSVAFRCGDVRSSAAEETETAEVADSSEEAQADETAESSEATDAVEGTGDTQEPVQTDGQGTDEGQEADAEGETEEVSLAAQVVAMMNEKEEGAASFCTMVIPPVFKPGDETNVFVNKSYPMESSIIRYSEYYKGGDPLLTNRERKELAQNGDTQTVSDPEKLTKAVYQETMYLAYNNQYGEDVGFEVASFDNITIDGFPGFKIASSYKVPDEEKIYQTVYMIISKDKVFTITFQRAEDDDCETYFEECAQTIRVR